METDEQPGMASGPAPEGAERLESWKEIADYLHRGVRTVQRWEKLEGLPVHRLQHDRAGSVFAYVAELDDWREQRRHLAEAPEEPAVPTAVWVGGGVALLILVLTGLAYLLGRDPDATPAAPRIVLAVLPFENLGPTPEAEYFGLGMTEEIIAQAASLRPDRLAVVGRTSVTRFQNTRLSLKEIGERLGADYLLEGSVRQEDWRVRITAQLIRASDETHLWAESYESELGQVLAVQREVARNIARALALELLPESAASPSESDHAPAAYDAYLRGRYLWHKGERDNYRQSIQLFEQAVSLEPEFARAYEGVALGHAFLGRYGMAPPEQSFPAARDSAGRALALDPNLPEAHLALALAAFYYDWDWETAEREFEAAIRMNPELAVAHHQYAHFLSSLGRHELALAEARRAQELEPLWPLVITDAGWFYLRARQYDEAGRACRKALELEPTLFSPVSCLVSVYKLQGDPERARAELKSYLQTVNQDWAGAGLGVPDPEEALRRYARWRLAQLDELRGEYVSPYPYFAYSLQSGDTEAALTWLERAYQVRDRVVLLVEVHPMFDSLRGDARFEKIRRDVGLPVR